MIKFIPVRHIKKSTLQINREIHQMPYTILYFAKYFEIEEHSDRLQHMTELSFYLCCQATVRKQTIQ